MKKTFKLTIFLLILVLTMSALFACDIKSDYLKYNDTKDQVIGLDTEYKGSKLTISDSDVTSIASGAFKGLDITEVVITSPITEIDASTFENCAKLKEVTIPASVTKIGANAFAGCTSLKTIVFADGSQLEEIGASAFLNCSKLKEISIPASVTKIGSNAFSNCAKLKTVNFGEGSKLTEVASGAFKGCEKLSADFRLPDSAIKVNVNALDENRIVETVILSIQDTKNTKEGYKAKFIETATSKILVDVFYFYSNEDADNKPLKDNDDYKALDLTKTFAKSKDENLNDGILSIMDNAFEDCTSIVSVKLPANLTSIGDKAFANLTELATVSFGEGNLALKEIGVSAFEDTKVGAFNLATVENIGDYAFSGTLLTEADLSAAKTIGESAFSDCDKLTTVTLGSSLEKIGAYAFSGASGAAFTFPATSALTDVGEKAFYGVATTTTDGVSYVATDKIAVAITGTDVTIGGIVIPEKLAANNANLTKVTISDTVVAIGNNAFANCKTLADVSVGNGVKTIGDNAFVNCEALASLTLGTAVTKIGTSAFEGAAIAKVEIPATIQNVGVKAFYGCEKLTEVKLATAAATTQADETVEIGASAFANCPAISTLDLGSTVNVIGANAFEDTDITSLVIPASVKTIGNNAFNNCYSLATLTLGTGVEKIGDSAFRNCAALVGADATNNTLTIPASVKTIGASAFFGTKIATLTFADNSVLETIGATAFGASDELASVTLPASLKTLGANAFAGCAKLTYTDGSYLGTKDNTHFALVKVDSESESFTINADTVLIGANAFKGCTKLTSIGIPASVKFINASAFAGCTKLTAINYAGSEADWANVTVGSNWKPSGATLYDSNSKKI